MRYFLGLGSNLGPRLENLRAAVQAMEELGIRVLRTSPVYETAPWGVTNQPDFLNAVVEAVSDFGPRDLLGRLKECEERLGRRKRGKWREREIDLDILLKEGPPVRLQNLVIPHPELVYRDFVLVPLLSLEPKLQHPVTGIPLKSYLSGTGNGVRKIEGTLKSC